MSDIGASFLRKTRSEIQNVPIVDGQLIFETDQENNSKIYTDIGTDRIIIGGKTDVENTLTSTSTIDALSANMGKTLDGKMNAIVDGTTPVAEATHATTADIATPKSHASANTTYGKGSGAQYGHLKLSNLTNSSNGIDDGTAATPYAVKTAYDKGVEAKTAADAKAPKSHASTDTTYGKGSNVNFGHLQLWNSVRGTAGEENGCAATPLAVKAAYDKADAAMPKSGGTFTGRVRSQSANFAGLGLRDVVVRTASEVDVSTNFLKFTRK